MTFSGTWGNTSFTCWAILAILWSSVPRLWTMKPRPIEAGLTPKVRNTTADIPTKLKYNQLNLLQVQNQMCWVIMWFFLLVDVCGTVCLFLLMCSALSALVIFVETKPSSQASSWKNRTHNNHIWCATIRWIVSKNIFSWSKQLQHKWSKGDMAGQNIGVIIHWIMCFWGLQWALTSLLNRYIIIKLRNCMNFLNSNTVWRLLLHICFIFKHLSLYEPTQLAIIILPPGLCWQTPVWTRHLAWILLGANWDEIEKQKSDVRKSFWQQLWQKKCSNSTGDFSETEFGTQSIQKLRRKEVLIVLMS